MASENGKSANALGVTGVILGVIALVICWIPLVNLLIIPLVLIGGLLTFIGLLVALTSRKSGVEWPIAGIVINLLALAAMIAVNVFIGSVLSN